MTKIFNNLRLSDRNFYGFLRLLRTFFQAHETPEVVILDDQAFNAILTLSTFFPSYIPRGMLTISVTDNSMRENKIISKFFPKLCELLSKRTKLNSRVFCRTQLAHMQFLAPSCSRQSLATLA